jgi:hypothetical protein
MTFNPAYSIQVQILIKNVLFVYFMKKGFDYVFSVSVEGDHDL